MLDTSPKPTSVSRWSKRNSNGRESDKPPAEINVNVVVIHSREFKCGKQFKHLFTEFGVDNYPAYSAGVLGVEDDDCVMLLLVMRSMVPDAIAEVRIEHWHEQVFDRKLGNVVALGSVGHLFELLKRHRSFFRRDFQLAVMDDHLEAHCEHEQTENGFEAVDVELA
jgi:hypothetical protein